MSRWVKIRTTDNGFEYAERKGVDSIAFVPFRNGYWRRSLLINDEYYESYGRRVKGTFNGSIDTDLSLPDLVLKELKEETGYIATKEDIISLGSIITCFPSNGLVHLYAIDVTKSKQGEQNLEGLEDIKPFWVDEDWSEICTNYEDPRLITIIARLNSLRK